MLPVFLPPEQPLCATALAMQGGHWVHGMEQVPLTTRVQEQEQGELQQEEHPSTAPGHGLRGFGITWDGDSSLLG